MGIFEPKLIMLDTGTIVQAVAKPADPQVRELCTILRSGDWIPFVTWHHLEELISHENDDVFRRRLDFFDDLPHLAYLKLREDGPDVGCVVDVRDFEITFITRHQRASHDEVIQ